MARYPIEIAPTLAVLLPILAILYTGSWRRPVIRFFFLYMCAKLAIDIFMWIAASQNQPNLYLENLEWIIRFYLFSKAFHEAFELSFNRATAMYGAGIYSFILGVDIIEHGFTLSLGYVGLAEAIIMLALCCAYLYETMVLLKVHWLPRHAPFYIICAVMFYFAGTLFISPLARGLNQHPYNKQMEIFILMPYVLETLSWIVITIGVLADRK